MTLSEELLKDLLIELKKMRTYRHEDITLSGNYVPGRDFQLYVGVEGTVIGISGDGKAVSRHFIAGYHPIMMRQITALGTTATDLAAIFE
jgi:ABC-type glutathione transport system ATPase component